MKNISPARIRAVITGTHTAKGEHPELAPLIELVEYFRALKGLGPTAKDHQPQVFQEEADPDGGYEGADAWGLAQGTVGPLVYEHPQQRREQHGAHQGHPPGQAELHRPEPGEIAPHHQHVAVGKVDQPQDAVDHGVAYGDQRIEAAKRQAVYELLQCLGAIHAVPLALNVPGGG